MITEDVDIVLRDVCIEIEKRFENRFLEIGSEGDPIHLLVQSVPTYSAHPNVVKIWRDSTAYKTDDPEICYYLSSESFDRRTPEQWLDLVRGHWGGV